VDRRTEAETAGRNAWLQSTQNGGAAKAARPADVIELGRRVLDGRPDEMKDAEATAFGEAAAPIELESVAPSQSIDTSTPESMDLGLAFVTAKPRDSISKLVGSTDPAAIGKFLSLNGMDGASSTLRPGRCYIVPSAWEDASESELANGRALLRADNGRLQAIADRRGADGRIAQRFREGRNIWTGELPAPPGMTRSRPSRPAPSGLDNSPVAKTIAGTLAYGAGIVPGVVRGAVDSGVDAAKAAYFAQRLLTPLDVILSKPGDTALEQVLRAGQTGADYAARGVANPQVVRDDIAERFHGFRLKHDPTATPVAETFVGELRNAFDLGMNHGHLAFDLGSLAVGGELIRGAAGARAVARRAGAAEQALLVDRPGLAAYFAQPYGGKGHHILARRTKLPAPFQRSPIRKEIMENPFNKIRDKKISNRDLYRNHVGVDRSYYGGKVPKRFGGGSWSAKHLGWEKYGPLDRFIYGTAPPTQAVIGVDAIGGPIADLAGWEESE
jgi:hypothetical protein